jgi:hypothetical protein
MTESRDAHRGLRAEDVRRTRHVVALLIGVALSLASRGAAAGPARRVALEWTQGDPTCVSAADLAAMVERTLGRAVFHEDAPPSATVTGTVAKVSAGQFEARVTLRGRDRALVAERTLTTQGDCGRLDESIALVVTLMIDSVEESPTTLQVPARPPRSAPPVVGAPSSPAPGLTLRLGLGAGLSWSLLPSFVPSASLRGEIAPRRFIPLALTVRVHPLASVVQSNGVGGKFTAWTADLAACPAWSSERLRAGGCAGLGGGMLEGSEVNLLDGESHMRPLVLATLAPFVMVRLGGPVWARVEAGAWFPLLREPWGYLNARGVFTELFRPAPVVPAAALTFDVQSGS